MRVLCVVTHRYSIDVFGRDVVRGYGSLAIPPFTGQYVRYCRTFRPRSSSAVQSVIAWLTVRIVPRVWYIPRVCVLLSYVYVDARVNVKEGTRLHTSATCSTAGRSVRPSVLPPSLRWSSATHQHTCIYLFIYLRVVSD